MNESGIVAIDHVSIALGEEPVTVDDAAARGWLVSDPRHLREVGFLHHRVCRPETSAYDLAHRATAPLRPWLERVGAIVYGTALPCNSGLLPPSEYARTREVRQLAQCPGSRLQAELGLTQACVIGITQQACTGLFGAIRVARGLLSAEPELHAVLCVAADRVPEGSLRESTYNPLSDGAIACIVSRAAAGFRVLATHQITNGALQSSSADELVSTYFTYTHRLIDETLRKAGLTLRDIDWIVPQNLARTAWQVMSSFLRFDRARVLFPTLADAGHLVSGCNFVNLRRGIDDGTFARGERILLPMAGYGLNWQCLVLQAEGA